MTLSVESCVGAIRQHGAQLATVAAHSMNESVAHCPGWTVADVLRHLIDVQWFWATIVQRGLSEPPVDGRPVHVDVDQLLADFVSGVDHLASVLESSDQRDAVWTWAPAQQDVAFVTRHQVQEIVVHHWDVAHAARVELLIDGDVASDAVSDFLTFSVSSVADPADPLGDPLGGRLGLWATDVAQGWTVRDDRIAGTITHDDTLEPGVPTLSATSGELLLWLYSRRSLEGSPAALALGERLHSLSFTS